MREEASRLLLLAMLEQEIRLRYRCLYEMKNALLQTLRCAASSYTLAGQVA